MGGCDDENPYQCLGGGGGGSNNRNLLAKMGLYGVDPANCFAFC